MLFSFRFLFLFLKNLLWGSELQAPIRPEDLVQLGLWTGFHPHGFGGRVTQNGIRTFNFQNTHTLQQMCFIGTAK